MSAVRTPVRRLVVGICEDDPAVRRLLQEALRHAGHAGVVTTTAAHAVARFSGDASIDVLVLDIGLPDGDGRDVVRALRANGQRAPAMFLSASAQVHDVVRGFAVGALDYLVKPFAVAELMVRVESLARRTPAATPPAGLRVDLARFALCRGDRSQTMSPTEFRIAAHLLAHPGEVVRRAELVDAAWMPGARVNGNTLDTYLHRIRRRLRALESPTRIDTVRGVGYVVRGMAP